jgi:proprotein convertase subtilisin/kexin type 5
MNILAILAFVYTLFSITSQQQCTSSTFERCLCITSTPYCTCSALTSTNTLNFSSSYNSHLVAVASQGCRPCPSNCLRCSSLTVCTLCLSSFELVSGQCQACPVNCQTCSNGVCATCITGYYLDYQTNCQTCPIIGTSVCTISSLQSCLSNYWLDNNAANCISCDANCYQCSSTTKCSLCNQGFYLASNYTCSPCLTQCLTCSDANSCILCANQSSYYNSTLGLCLAGTTSNCLISATNSRCSQCLPGYFLNSSSLCV